MSRIGALGCRCAVRVTMTVTQAVPVFQNLKPEADDSKISMMMKGPEPES
jgi:hypothetical protein